MKFMSWRRSALYDVNDCGPLLLTWLTWPEVFSQKLCLGKFFTFSHKTRTYVVQCTPELMDHPVRVMILKLLYTTFKQHMLQRVKIPLRSLFTTYHHHLALVCTSYSHLMLWALVYWLRSLLLLVHGCVSKLQSCVTLLIAETTQDTYLLLCGKMISDNNKPNFLHLK